MLASGRNTGAMVTDTGLELAMTEVDVGIEIATADVMDAPLVDVSPVDAVDAHPMFPATCHRTCRTFASGLPADSTLRDGTIEMWTFAITTTTARRLRIPNALAAAEKIRRGRRRATDNRTDR